MFTCFQVFNKYSSQPLHVYMFSPCTALYLHLIIIISHMHYACLLVFRFSTCIRANVYMFTGFHHVLLYTYIWSWARCMFTCFQVFNMNMILNNTTNIGISHLIIYIYMFMGFSLFISKLHKLIYCKYKFVYSLNFWFSILFLKVYRLHELRWKPSKIKNHVHNRWITTGHIYLLHTQLFWRTVWS